MADNDTIRRLFENVLLEDIRLHRLSHADIRTGIQNMKEAYKPKPQSLSSNVSDPANYNDAAHRCAYLHKYAPLHTALVKDMLGKSMQQVKPFLQAILLETGRIEVCSLGGGPGSDVLGVISVLSAELGFFQFSSTIIDCMENWKYTFAAIIRELCSGYYGSISYFVQPQYFTWNYIGHNLLGKMSNDANKAIQGANLITMVKFVSAAACKDTAEMIKKIFRSLKPGALALFIDNDAGGFYRLVAQGAQESSMTTVFGPLFHEHYVNHSFNVKRFGYTPCLETKVTVHMWMKPNYNRSNILSAVSRGNTSRPSTRNVSTTFNRYNISNTNIFVSETNNLNSLSIQRQPQNHALPSSISKTHNSNNSQVVAQKRIQTPRQNSGNRPSSTPSGRQSCDHIMPRNCSATSNENRSLSAQKSVKKPSQLSATNRSSHTPILRQPQGNLLPTSSHITNIPKHIMQYPTPSNSAYQSSPIPNQRQHQNHISPYHGSPANSSNTRENEVDCCNCCVIS